MDLNSLIQYATLFTLIIGIAGVGVAALAHRRETNASIYLDFSQRLHALYQSIPHEERAARLAGEAHFESPQFLVIMLDFLHEVKSAFLLNQAGYLTGALWIALRIDIERGLRMPPVRAKWPLLRAEFSGFPAFIEYIDSVMRT